MRILVVNDDGIEAEGIKRLAEMAKNLGEVWVVAPERQCSAMSHSITVRKDLEVKKVSYPVEGVRAYSVSGTPADCVKAALFHIMPEKPDVVFSGINFGYNAGVDILYSGTVGAAMEAVINGICAIAFSCEVNGIYDAVDEYLLPITKELLAEELLEDEIWNVNFPGCTKEELHGILRNRIPSHGPFYRDNYDAEKTEGSVRLKDAAIRVDTAGENTDIYALLNHCISIGKLKNMILSAK